MRNGKTPTCDIEVGHRRTSATLIGNKRLRYEYRPPLRFPDAV